MSFLIIVEREHPRSIPRGRTFQVLAYEYQKCDYKVIKLIYWTTIPNTTANECYFIKVIHMRKLYTSLIMLSLLKTVQNSSLLTTFRESCKKIGLIILLSCHILIKICITQPNHPSFSQEFGRFQKSNPPLKDEDLPPLRIFKRMCHRLWKQFRGVPKMLWAMVVSLQYVFSLLEVTSERNN